MENTTLVIIVGIIGIAAGFVIAKVLEKKNATKMISGAKKEAQKILKEAKTEGESIKKDKILQAKEKFLELKAEHEKVIISKDKKRFNLSKKLEIPVWSMNLFIKLIPPKGVTCLSEYSMGRLTIWVKFDLI